MALTALLLALWRYLVWKRQKLVAEQDPNDKPPYFWNVHIESVNDFLEHDGFDRVSQLLRKRADTDTLRLDMPRTIQATVEKGGMPEFHFKKQTTPSEYLLLIDRQSVRNHRAQLFDKLYEAFKAQEIEIHRYFYDSDMRMCFDEAHPYGISIADVQQRHYQSRLIVVGTGAQMLAPLSGKLAAWTSIFAQWKDRALLTPKPLKAWGYDERQLASLFTTLPSTLQGLGFWVEELDMGNDARFEMWREKIHDAPNAPIQPDELDPMPMLSLYYDIPMLKWICACAIYPTLHWDLTLWLGQTIWDLGFEISVGLPPKSEIPNPKSSAPLSNFDNLSQLTRLSWFVSGEMPNETRVALINWFEEHDPELLQHLRLAIALELQKNPPPKDSVAFEPFRMNVAVNEWLATDDAARKKELEEEIKQLLEKGIDPDFTVIKYLTKPRTKLEFYMPDAWRKYVYPKGLSALGWLKELKDLRWLLPLWVLGLVALFYSYNFKTNNCSTDRVVSLTVRDTTRYFCLDEPLSALAYQEQLVHEAVERERMDSVAMYLDADNPYELNTTKLVNEVQIEDTAVQRLMSERNANFAVDYYRLAKQFYDNKLKDSACFYLNIATQFDSTDTDIKVAQAFVCEKKPVIGDKNQFDIAPVINGNVVERTFVELTGREAQNLIDGGIAAVTDGNPKPLANVQITGAGINTRTDARGRYTLTLPPQYPSPTIALTFTKKDYNTVSQTMTIDKVKQLPIVSLTPISKKIETPKPPIDTPNKKPNPITPPTPVVITTPSVSEPKDTVKTEQTSPNPQSSTLIAPATVPVKGGTFTMGCTKEQGSDCQDDEKPAHQVTLSDFNIGKYEVTNEQFVQFLNEKGNQTEGGIEWLDLGKEDYYDIDDIKGRFTIKNGREKMPIRNISWYGATAYCNWLSNKTGKTYRLPTEAEWEYAARGGNQSRGYKYSGSNNIGEVAWYNDNSDSKTYTVGTKKGNELGIYDMSGNVWEWCSDFYSNYSSAAVKNPTGAERGASRVLRGGSWLNTAQGCRVSNRGSYAPADRGTDLGFRVVFSP